MNIVIKLWFTSCSMHSSKHLVFHIIVIENPCNEVHALTYAYDDLNALYYE